MEVYNLLDHSHSKSGTAHLCGIKRGEKLFNGLLVHTGSSSTLPLSGKSFVNFIFAEFNLLRMPDIIPSTILLISISWRFNEVVLPYSTIFEITWLIEETPLDTTSMTVSFPGSQ